MKKKITAFTLAAAIIIGVLGLSGCADTKIALTVAGTEMLAGEYIRAQLSAAQSAADKFREENPDADIYEESFDFFAQKIEDKSFADWVNEEALKFCSDRKAAALLFDELELTLTDEQEREIRLYVENLWQSSDSMADAGLSENTWGEFFESVGVGKESTVNVLTYENKMEKVFHAYYDPDGIEGVPESEMKAKLTDEYARFRMLRLYYDEEVIDNKQLEETAAGYADKLNAGESFIAVRNEFYDFFDSLYAEEAEESEEPEELPEESDYEEAENENTENEEDILEITEEEDDNSEDLAEKLGSPYYLDEDGQEFLFSMNINTAAIYKTEDACYVLQRLDISEREDWFENIKESLLHEMKGEDFKNMIREKGQALATNINDAAIKRYKPQTIAKKGLL